MLAHVTRIAYFAPFVFWLLVVAYTGTHGAYMALCLASAAVGGWVLGTYVIPHGIAIGHIPRGRTWGAAALCILIPLVCLLMAGRAEKMTEARSPQQGSPTANQPVPPIPAGVPVMANSGDIMATNAQSFDAGRATAYDPPQTFGRATADIRVVQVGTGKWRIRFQTPGPAMIRTGLPISQGETYYIKMDKEAESIQFGWLGEDEQGLVRFAPASAPASALVDSVPLRYTMSSWANNAQLAFNTSTIPDGRYEITITKSQFNVKSNEYAPGIPLKNRW